MRGSRMIPAALALRGVRDEFGGNHVWVKGHTKVMSHLMFGVLVLSVDQLMRLLQ